MKTARKFVTKSDESELELITKAAAKVETLAEKQKKLEATVEDHTGKIAKGDELRERLQDVEQRIAKGLPAASGLAPSGFNAKSLFEDAHFQNFIGERGPKSSGKIAIRDVQDDDNDKAGGLSIKSLLLGDTSADTSAIEVPTGRERIEALMFPMRPIRLLDALPIFTMQLPMIEYAQMRWDSNAAAETTEGELKPEQDFIITPKTARTSTIAVWTQASLQILSDVPGLSMTIGQVLQHNLLDRLERQVLNGTGTGSNIEGILPQVDFYLGNEPEKVDRIGAALVELENLGFQPNVIVMNPLDWFQVQSAKTNGPEEFYRYGNPAQPLQPTLWNRRVITTPAIARDTVLVGDSNFATVLDRQQPTIELSRNDRSNFVTNLVTILAELRAGLALLRQDAFLKVDLGAIT